MENLQSDSRLISEILSRIGYNENIRLLRQKTNDILDASAYSMQDGDDIFSVCTAGSKAEGLSSIAENDIDKMIILPEAVCFEYPHENDFRGHVFALLKNKDNPGYAYLQLVSINESLRNALRISLVENKPEQFYLSSDVWKTFFKEAAMDFSNDTRNNDFMRTSRDTDGPATVVSFGFLSFDSVYALKCICPSYLNAWVHRTRQYQWPSPEDIKIVSNLDSHVVPVGYNTNPFKCIEWRICYTKAEIHLVRSLNDCLIKVYILMKGIAKVTLKPICKDMSSYIMKNIILWIAENNPAECFSENNMIQVLQFAFRVLKRYLVSRNLPSYMIPERNLIADRVTIEETSKLCMRIDCLLKEGSKMVMRIDKVRNALTNLYLSPDEFEAYTIRRQEYETIVLQLWIYVLKFIDVGNPDVETFYRRMLSDDGLTRVIQYATRNLLESTKDSCSQTEQSRTSFDKLVKLFRKRNYENNRVRQFLS